MIKKLVIGIILFVIVSATWLLPQLGPLGTGMAAKVMCSSVFISGLEPDRVLKEELAQYPYLTANVDHEQSSATSKLLGMFQRDAYYAEGVGCRLDQRPSEWQPQQYPVSAATLPITDPSSELKPVITNMFSEPDPESLRNTRAVLLIHKGKIIIEAYARGISPSTPLIGWSMSKSLLGILAGLMVQDGLLTIDNHDLAPEWSKRDPRGDISVNQALRMLDGLDFDESYGPFGDPGLMLYTISDAAAFTAQKALAHQPGEHWSYSSGTSNLLARYLQNRLADAGYSARDYLQQRLFATLGISDMVIEADQANTLILSSWAYGSARAWGRLGQLLLDDGIANGKRLLPEGWVDYVRKPTEQSDERKYGAHFWVNDPTGKGEGQYPGLPEDAYFMLGFQSQSVSVFPKQDLVVVRLGMTQQRSAWPHAEMMQPILRVIDVY